MTEQNAEPKAVTAGEENHEDPFEYAGEAADAPDDTGRPEAPSAQEPPVLKEDRVDLVDPDAPQPDLGPTDMVREARDDLADENPVNDPTIPSPPQGTGEPQ